MSPLMCEHAADSSHNSAASHGAYKQQRRAKDAHGGSKCSRSKAGAGGGRQERVPGFMLIHYSIRPCDRDKDQHVSK